MDNMVRVKPMTTVPGARSLRRDEARPGDDAELQRMASFSLRQSSKRLRAIADATSLALRVRLARLSAQLIRYADELEPPAAEETAECKSPDLPHPERPPHDGPPV